MQMPSIVDAIRHTLSHDLGAAAVEYRERWFTRRDMRTVAESLDAQLVDAAVTPGQRVGLVVRNDPTHLAAMFALIAGGRCVVLISPFQQPERLAAELAGLQLAAVVADRSDWSPAALSAVRTSGGLAIGSSSDGALSLAPMGGALEPRPSRGKQVAHAIELLTSGTSGVPKRIPFTLATLDEAMRHQIAFTRAMGESKDCVLIQYPPMASISGAWNALQMGIEGQRLVMLEKFAVPEWHRAVRLYRPNFVALPPAMLRMVLEADLPREDLASIRSVRVGSAPIDRATKERFEKTYGIPLLMIYGATEYAGPFAAWSLEEHRRLGQAKQGSTGRIDTAIATVRIVDPQTGSELPRGETGRLEVRLRRVGPDWISTNDLASVDSDDFLYVHGRADDAIIRGGFKIPPDTIADVLRTHPAVSDVAVVGVPHARLGQVPVAAVELKPGAAADEAELLDLARRSLIAYQIPVTVRIVARLPRTPLGKTFRPGVRALFDDWVADD
jgi:long-chain acyl-CoA synthetase